MMSFVIVLHIVVCAVLIAIILIQRGRGGGFVEGFSGLESMFGTKTSAFLTKSTSVLAVTFFITCLLLAGLSLQRSKSLMRGIRQKAAPVQKEAVNQTTSEKSPQTSDASQASAALQPQGQPADQAANAAEQSQTNQTAQGK